jgi:hypothetical protein
MENNMNLQESIRNDLNKITEANNNDLSTSLYAYERGVDDGFFGGNDNNTFSTNEQRHAYKRGYDHGVWMYTENAHPEESNEGVNEDGMSKDQAERISNAIDEDLDEIYEIVFGANGNANHTHGELVEVLRALMKGNPNIIDKVYQSTSAFSN